MDRNLITTSKFLSLILRHKPETIGMRLDPDGWLEISSLIENANRHGTTISLELLHDVVASNDKQRFALSDDGLFIRANKGHSVPHVDLNLSPVAPPDQLFHGTVRQFLPAIRAGGLLKRSRNHVHLSSEHESAFNVGRRRGTPVILGIASHEMHDAGYKFFLSANHVWLTDHVPIEFISFP